MYNVPVYLRPDSSSGLGICVTHKHTAIRMTNRDISQTVDGGIWKGRIIVLPTLVYRIELNVDILTDLSTLQ